MQSTSSASMRARRMSRCLGRLCGLAFGLNDALRAGQSPDWFDDMLPLARMKSVMFSIAVLMTRGLAARARHALPRGAGAAWLSCEAMEIMRGDEGR